MNNFEKMPQPLTQAYRNWLATDFAAQESHFAQLAQGQSPTTMVISCCDSRVQPTDIMQARAGDFFVHRNIANLVPSPTSDALRAGLATGTFAAVEYAVQALKVAHIVVMGHAQCGGVQACYDLCSADKSAAESGFDYVGDWLEALRPAFARLQQEDEAARIVEMGHAGVVMSLENLLAFAPVAEAVATDRLSLHGAWHDFATGILYGLNPHSGCFEPI